MTEAKPVTFDKPWLILCEGIGDQNFLSHLLSHRGIGDFQIQPPPKTSGMGRAAFGKYLNSVVTSEEFLTTVQGLLVVSDNDTAESFSEVQRELRRVAGLGVPAARQTVTHSKAPLPPVEVLMIPLEGTGNLETVCLEAAYAKWPIKAQLDEFVAKVPARDWPEGKQAKMRMQTILAAHNDSQPDTGFPASWNQRPQYRVPIDHQCFAEIADAIAGFPVMVAAM